MARLFVALLLLLGLMAATAYAAGGAEIASAPDIPLGVAQEAALERVDFWRVPLNVGDRLVVNYGSTNGNTIEVCVLKPSVTDYTLQESTCERVDGIDGTHTKAQVRFVALQGGRWTFAIASELCIAGKRIIPSCDYDVAYEFTAFVQRRTRTTLSGPSVSRCRESATFVGRVEGVTTGRAEIQTAKPRGGWKSVALVDIRSDGTFTWKTRTSTTGTYRVRAKYRGDATHRPSSATVTLRVAGC